MTKPKTIRQWALEQSCDGTHEGAVDVLTPLLARCNPPGYDVSPCPRGVDAEWCWDSCDEHPLGHGFADTEDEARAAAWVCFFEREAERVEDEQRTPL